MSNTIPFIIIALFLLTIFYWYKRKSNTDKTKTIRVEELDSQDDKAYSEYFDVVGESFANEDGTSRQEIIKKYAQEGDPLHLKFYAYKSSLACAVSLDEKHQKQIGHIAKDDVQEVYDIVTDDTLAVFPQIESIGSGSKGLYGVTIEILIKEK